jgi:signal transduction histidine kinase
MDKEKDIKKAKKILVIDDEEGIRTLIDAILSKEGYEVYLAEDGYKGIDLFKQVPLDLVITDIKMPGIDGIEVLRRMKAIDPEAEIIILTGHGNLDTAIAAIKEDAYDFVTKPLENIQILISAVKKGIRKSELTAENKKLIDKLKKANIELNQKNKNYFEVLGFVSHELRNALTILSGFVALFQERTLGRLNKDQKEVMDRIAYNVESINHLITNYLNLSKIEKDELRVEKCELDVFNDVLKGVIDIIKLQAKRSGLNVDLSLGGIPPGIKLKADLGLLRMVFLNLFLNAIKYTKEGGKISYGYKDCGDHYRFNVYNEGAGIPEKYRKKVFEKFMRLKPVTGRGKSGSGLGLFTVKKIIESHGGRIWVESKIGMGTNFIFELPKDER